MAGEALVAALDRMIARVDPATAAAANAMAMMLEAAAKANFQGAHKRGEPHVGGDKPNIVTGTLRRSITAQTHRDGLGAYAVTVGSGVVYARRVELGYTGGGRGRGHQTTRAFPYLEPAMHDNAARMRAAGIAAWAAVFTS